jgi:hypothetical protein
MSKIFLLQIIICEEFLVILTHIFCARDCQKYLFLAIKWQLNGKMAPSKWQDEGVFWQDEGVFWQDEKR